MKKELLFIFVVSFSCMFSFIFVQDVKAYEENAFSNESCITNTTWTENAMTEYKLNNETGTYELSGENYDSYTSSGKTDKHIFYLSSGDGKVLYAFVPNYGTVTSTDAGKNEMMGAGINPVARCATDTLIVNKTVVGNPPNEDSYMDFGAEDNGVSSPSDDNTPEPTDEDENQSNEPNDPNEEGSENEVTKIESPNTASPMTITAIILSILFVGIAVYSFIKKAHPELLEKFKIRR